MTHHCSICSSNGRIECACNSSMKIGDNADGRVRLFGVSLTDESFIKKSASMGNLSQSQFSGTGDSPEGYHSDDPDRGSAAVVRRRAHGKRGNPWTNEEHGQFLVGLQKLGKGDWRGISRTYVPSKTPTQVASHAQKYFIRQSDTRKKRRPSVFDTVPEMETNSSSTQQLFSIQSPAAVTDSEKLTLLPSQESDINKLLPSLDLSLKPIYMPLPFQLWPPTPSPFKADAAGPSHRRIFRTIPDATKEPGKELVGISKLTLEETRAAQFEPPLLSLRLPGEP